MKKAILMSIKPEWLEKILNGEKTIEIRKTMPKCDLPIDVYLYCTNTPKYHHLYDLTYVNKGQIFYAVTQHNKYSLVAKGFLNGKVVAKFTLNKCEKIKSCFVPYRKENNLYYELFIDNGVYHNEDDKEKEQKYNELSGLVFERDDRYINSMLKNEDFEKMCLTPMEIWYYLKNNKNDGYGVFYIWHIDNLQIFNKPVELSEFVNIKALSYDDWLYSIYNGHNGARNNYNSYLNIFRLKRPAQSWQYVWVKE